MHSCAWRAELMSLLFHPWVRNLLLQWKYLRLGQNLRQKKTKLKLDLTMPQELNISLLHTSAKTICSAASVNLLLYFLAQSSESLSLCFWESSTQPGRFTPMLIVKFACGRHIHVSACYLYWLSASNSNYHWFCMHKLEHIRMDQGKWLSHTLQWALNRIYTYNLRRCCNKAYMIHFSQKGVTNEYVIYNNVTNVL